MGRRKKKDNKRIFKFIITLIIAVLLIYIGKDYIPEEYKNKIQDEIELAKVNLPVKAIKQEQVTTKVDGDLKVYFIDVGQADSILVTNKKNTMLIDAGNNEDGELVADYIKKLGIKKIDYLIGTHPHEDHIGGLDNIIKNFEIGTVYMPETTTNTKTYEEVLDAMLEKNLSLTVPKVGDSFKMGESENEIISINNDNKNLNNCSIVIKTIYGNQSFLFMGDAEDDIEAKIKLTESTVLKVGHHGSSTSTSQILLNKVKPKYAIISVGNDNDYGHPTNKTLERLNQYGCEIHRTDLEGTIIISTDGKNIQINTVKTKTNGN